MGSEDSEEVRLALLEHRVRGLEDDRKWLLGTAWAGILYITSQVLPYLPTLLKGMGK